MWNFSMRTVSKDDWPEKRHEGLLMHACDLLASCFRAFKSRDWNLEEFSRCCSTCTSTCKVLRRLLLLIYYYSIFSILVITLSCVLLYFLSTVDTWDSFPKATLLLASTVTDHSLLLSFELNTDFCFTSLVHLSLKNSEFHNSRTLVFTNK